MSAPAFGQKSAEASLPIVGSISLDGQSVTLDFSLADPPRVGTVNIDRRTLGETGNETWLPLAQNLGPVLGYRDTTTQPGIAYEYRVTRSAKDIVDVGFFTLGRDLPAIERRGKALLIVDEVIAEPLQQRLGRFARDLTGDGWEVVFQRGPRDDGKDRLKSLERADAIRTWIKTQYEADPFDTYAVILVGRLPYVMAGRVGPDGHGLRPHPTDLFYGDVDGLWGLAQDEEGQIFVANSQVPSDWIEVQVGRIDFSQARAESSDEELRLLRAYFDKNHHWRNGLHGDLRNAYWDRTALVVEKDGLLNIVGSDAITKGGHHDVGEERPWLWGVDFGSNKSKQYKSKFRNKAVFAINFGSHKQKIERANNALRAILAQPWYTVAAGWGARPSWRLHHMALGATIGTTHMRTVNNGRASDSYRASLDYFPTGAYLWRNPIWVNLLGDPTLRAFVLAPPRALEALRQGARVQIDWSASPDQDVTGYNIYRAMGDGPFELISEQAGDARSYADPDAPPEARYMIRAKGLKTVTAGSFHTFSQGAFAFPNADELEAEALVTEGIAGTAIPLPLLEENAETGLMQALIEGAKHGRLEVLDGRWIYTPAEDFAGQEVLRFTSSNQIKTVEGSLTINVQAAPPLNSQ